MSFPALDSRDTVSKALSPVGAVQSVAACASTWIFAQPHFWANVDVEEVDVVERHSPCPQSS